ncbi:MAG: carbohydrate kinase family protein [Armatimonadota bacterium]|nr:carbohydrate kinase family protein [Armatimonadota bacterium]
MDTPAADYDVCVYGTVCVDRIRRVQNLPPPGGYVEVLEERWMPGGEALNTAIALVTWGARVALVPNALGEDALAEHLLSMLGGYPSLDLRFLRRRSDVQTPTCDVYVTPDGHRTMFGTGFARMSADSIPVPALQGVKAFTADANPGEASVSACEQAARAGVPVVAMDLHDVERAARVADILLTSYEWVGRNNDIDVLRRIAAQYRERFGCTVILTAGARGCVLAERERRNVVHMPAYRAPAIVDTTGSGDVFRAGLIYGRYVLEREIEWAIRFGSAAAALNAGAMGACAGVRSGEEIEQFMRTQNTI